MITVVPHDRFGRTETDWLSARHHFSFGGWMDPARMSFGPLRVWNDDLFRAGGGIGMHPHRDMEIITYVHRGALTHEDSLGNHGVTEAGNVQVMSAGTGIVHSEFNHTRGDLELFQIWLTPDRPGHAPRWENGAFSRDRRRNRLVALASGRNGAKGAKGANGANGALRIHQDATLYAAELDAGASVAHGLGASRRAYVVPVRGALRLNDVAVPARSAAEVRDTETLTLTAAGEATEVVLRGATTLRRSTIAPGGHAAFQSGTIKPQSNIVLSVSAPVDIQIGIYTTEGRLVRTLSQKRIAPGSHSIFWDGRTNSGAAAALGMYHYHIEKL